MMCADRGRVLVVEDDALVAEMVQGLLESQGYSVAGVARDGRAAVDAVERLKPDVVMMDLQMPEMDGIEATRRIQQRCPTPVVVLTAHDDLRLTAEAASAGVSAYLVKPPSGRELARAITLARARFAEELVMRELIAELSARSDGLGAFAHTVAHDLRNALTPVMGIAQLLCEDFQSTPPEEARKQLGMIADRGQKLRRMIDDLLMLAEVRERDLAPAPLDMDEILDEAWERLCPMVEELEPEIVAPETWPVALGYAPWVVEVWVNYLSNACKYGGRPLRIELGYQVSDRLNIRFYVRDSGPGLTDIEQDQLFTPFVQLNPTQAAGHGLGLSIVRRIVEKLGGGVGVESKVGQGSTFWFTLPSARRDA